MESQIDVLMPKPQNGFVETPFIKSLVERALLYIKMGYPVHLSGPTGCGKTILAMHLAHKIGRPMVLINGDESVGSGSLLGGEFGYVKKKLVDNFVSRVVKTEESMMKTWEDERLTSACKHGFTLIYNEFTRSKPEVNNVLLPVLEEKVLNLPKGTSSESYIRVHPDFSAIFTSNPEEYAGVYRSQDALLDRMVTLSLAHYDAETEVAITVAKSGVDEERAKRIVSLVRRLRDSDFCENLPTVRASIMLAKAVVKANARFGDSLFYQLCYDILYPKIGRGKGQKLDPKIILDELLMAEGLYSHKKESEVPKIKSRM